MSARVAVVGSVNVDTTLYVRSFSRPGETAIGDSMLIALGGKGANQAVAAAQSGAEVLFIAAVGDDQHGAFVRDELPRQGVRVEGIQELPNEQTGCAFVTVSREGENSIVVLPGANAKLSERALEAVWPRVRAHGYVVAQA